MIEFTAPDGCIPGETLSAKLGEGVQVDVVLPKDLPEDRKIKVEVDVPIPREVIESAAVRRAASAPSSSSADAEVDADADADVDADAADADADAADADANADVANVDADTNAADAGADATAPAGADSNAGAEEREESASELQENWFGLSMQSFYDSKPVRMSTTIHPTPALREKVRRVYKDGVRTFIKYLRLGAIDDYNKNMDGVDLQDQLRWYYRPDGKRTWHWRKWPWAVYSFVINTRVVQVRESEKKKWKELNILKYSPETIFGKGRKERKIATYLFEISRRTLFTRCSPRPPLKTGKERWTPK